jgi:hypothetical protein
MFLLRASFCVIVAFATFFIESSDCIAVQDWMTMPSLPSACQSVATCYQAIVSGLPMTASACLFPACPQDFQLVNQYVSGIEPQISTGLKLNLSKFDLLGNSEPVPTCTRANPYSLMTNIQERMTRFPFHCFLISIF